MEEMEKKKCFENLIKKIKMTFINLPTFGTLKLGA